jgi:putative methyltransferase (TIGR04325 family)
MNFAQKVGRRIRVRAVEKIKMIKGRALLASPMYLRFRGAYESYDDALKAIPQHRLAGYNHESVAELNFELMSQIAPWDYPVLFWLQRLLPNAKSILDAGGHMGTKFRAFQGYIPLGPPTSWIVYDLPAIVKVGKRWAEKDGLEGIEFTSDITAINRCDILLASGLLQYLDQPFTDILQQLPELPRHLIINKLAVRDGATLVTLEDIGHAFVPYQIRSRQPFFSALEVLGYRSVDEWEIPSLSHVIPTHPEFGASKSVGCYLTLGSGTP